MWHFVQLEILFGAHRHCGSCDFVSVVLWLFVSLTTRWGSWAFVLCFLHMRAGNGVCRVGFVNQQYTCDWSGLRICPRHLIGIQLSCDLIFV